MKEQSVQKGFSKKSTREALFSCGQKQKTVRKVNREQCMCTNCFYRGLGKDGGCLFDATLENYEGLCMNYRGYMGYFPDGLHFDSSVRAALQQASPCRGRPVTCTPSGLPGLPPRQRPPSAFGNRPGHALQVESSRGIPPEVHVPARSSRVSFSRLALWHRFDKKTPLGVRGAV